MSTLLMCKNCTFPCATDMLRPDTGMKREIGLTATNDPVSNFDLQQRLSSLSMTGIPSDHSLGRMYPVSKGM